MFSSQNRKPTGGDQQTTCKDIKTASSPGMEVSTISRYLEASSGEQTPSGEQSIKPCQSYFPVICWNTLLNNILQEWLTSWQRVVHDTLVYQKRRKKKRHWCWRISSKHFFFLNKNPWVGSILKISSLCCRSWDLYLRVSTIHRSQLWFIAMNSIF